MQLTNMIAAVDAHACGEPGRVIIGGVLDVPGKTMFDKKKYLEEVGCLLNIVNNVLRKIRELSRSKGPLIFIRVNKRSFKKNRS